MSEADANLRFYQKEGAEKIWQNILPVSDLEKL